MQKFGLFVLLKSPSLLQRLLKQFICLPEVFFASIDSKKSFQVVKLKQISINSFLFHFQFINNKKDLCISKVY